MDVEMTATKLLGKKRSRLPAVTASNNEEEETEQLQPSSKRLCVPQQQQQTQVRRVSVIGGDLLPASPSANVVPSLYTPRSRLVRRVSTYLDDFRSQITRSLDGGSDSIQTHQSSTVHDIHRRLGGTNNPGLVPPSSSFMVSNANVVSDPTKVLLTSLSGGVGDDDADITSSGSDNDANADAAKEEKAPLAQVATKAIDEAVSSSTQQQPTTATSSTITSAPKSKKRQPQRSSSSSWKSTLFTRIIPLLIILEVALLFAERVFNLPFDPIFSLHGGHDHHQPIKPDSVCVPGAGFSGFWFTLGRLRSMPDPASKSYYCYSAGCLGVVATLANRTMEEMYDIASGAQRLWQDGTIGRYDVVPRFVDQLLDLDADDGVVKDTAPKRMEAGGNLTTTVEEPTMTDVNLLSKIHIITTTKGFMGVRHEVRTPQSIQELRKGLIHTTWIPYATGGSLWNYDAQTDDHHMDGAFSVKTHPRCTYHLDPPFMMDLFLNVINVNLGRDKVEKYWDAGVDFGSGL
mmetsp:Transcript_24178/g.35825  ORF Transcript_24178/g.35825 Transcript_24178/m.35825 type:complete len:516 (+) Transcript_24178:47-1594(+)